MREIDIAKVDGSPAVEFVELCKNFGSIVANRNVSFSIRCGTVHGIIGENGAGKSTLMSALFGLYRPDSGSIRLHGKQVTLDCPATAIGHGIGMVHQHFMLVERLSGLQNIILGNEGKFWLGGRMRRARALVQQIQERYSLHFPLDVPTRDLPVGVQQRVEIVKSLYRGADILVLDEPTSVLTPQEVQGLFRIFRELASEGKTVILITHKLQEIIDVTSSVTVLRNGSVIETRATKDVTRGELAEMMVGRRIVSNTASRPKSSTTAKVAVENLTIIDAAGTRRVSDLSFEIKSGEILGIAGVSGNGQTELLGCLAGQLPIAKGTVRLGTRSWDASRSITTLDIRKAGTALVPEDRLRHAIIGKWPARDNSVLGLQRSGAVPGVGARMDTAMMTSWCKDLMKRFDVRPVDPQRATSVFSGGNQQKLVIGRELSTNPEIIVVGQPTRGVDVGAIEAIHASILAERNSGKAILVVSVELEEVTSLSDRILVMFGGRSMGILERGEFDEAVIGLMMAGLSKSEAMSHQRKEKQS
ncbi:ABC transporter ATP-binding protein [Rhizobium sp. GCM10022189]|uniref:ABC transporter ATP-binding protein n=1 Tax=Rhizobium sp. GCM10022189 TaxID=3252654 RepID=UPI003619D0B1